MCWETALRFYISIRETFCQSIALKVVNKYSKGATVQISRMFLRIYHVACVVTMMDPLKQDFAGSYLSRFFGVCNFGNTQAMKVIFYFENVGNLN